jgi:hypothetical protein
VPRDLDRGAELTGDVVSDVEGPGSAHRAQYAGLLVMGAGERLHRSSYPGTADWSFGEDAITRAVDRTESTTVEQETETLDGQLAGVLPDAHQFEFRIADAKIPIGGAVDRAISATELANFNRTWVNVDARARFSVKRIRHNDDIC